VLALLLLPLVIVLLGATASTEVLSTASGAAKKADSNCRVRLRAFSCCEALPLAAAAAAALAAVAVRAWLLPAAAAAAPCKLLVLLGRLRLGCCCWDSFAELA
jgi:hypothetical protein